MSLFGKNGGEVERYKRYYSRCLKRLDEDGLFVLNDEQFEHITGTGGSNGPKLYAIRHPGSQLNERYIFFCIEGSRFVMLTAFLEKSGKDYYAPNIKRAYNIIAGLESD